MGESPQAEYLAEQAQRRADSKRENLIRKRDMLAEINRSVGLVYSERYPTPIDVEINRHLRLAYELLCLVTED